MGKQRKPLAIFKTGSTWPAMAQARGDFDDWLRRSLGEAEAHTVVVSVAETSTLVTELGKISVVR